MPIPLSRDSSEKIATDWGFLMRKFQRATVWRALVGAAFILGSRSGLAQDAVAQVDRLPEPLTLEYALSLATAGQPTLAKARAELARRDAKEQAAEALTGVNVGLEGRLRWVEPADLAADQSSDDHKGTLYVRKNLFDFGRSRASRQAAERLSEAGRYRYLDAVHRQGLLIMQRFFDVLLADLAFARDNEELAVIYVTLDRLRNRHELGQVSDITLLEVESEYQEVRRRRAESEAAQRATRARLAIALDRPGLLSADLAEPQLASLDRELPEYDALLEKALVANPVVRALRAEQEAARKGLDAARAGGNPILSGEAETSSYSREMGSYDEWRAGVQLIVPLYTGGALQAEIGEARAELDRVQAELIEAERQVREQVLELWLELQNLKVDRDRVRAMQDYRDLYLDLSRANYELEVKTDLGDAMVRLSEAQLADAANRFSRALAWARLDALTGDLALPDGTKN